MVTFALVTPNVGTLYRLRYGYLMLLVALASAAAIQRLRTRWPAR